MIGLGTVGSGVAKLLSQQADHIRAHTGHDFRIKWVIVRDPHKQRPDLPPDAEVAIDPQACLKDPEVSVIVELMGGVDPAFDWIAAALRAGKHVITANKAVLAERGRELFDIARQCDRVICFEAAVAGGIPAVAAVGQDLAANRIESITGILNGTSNFILTAMLREQLGYDEALQTAQSLGFAEADPTMDVDGTDAAQKLALLVRLAFGSHCQWDQIQRQGIDGLESADIHFAAELGYVIKLLAVARDHGASVVARVTPTLVHAEHPLAQIHNETNAIKVVGHAVGASLFCGKGAGQMPTASSVVADLMDLAIGRAERTFPALRLWDDREAAAAFDPAARMQNRFYLRLALSDQIGSLAKIASILGRHGINISSVIQHETTEGEIGAAVPLIVMTHVADEVAVQAALTEIDQLDIVARPSICLHVEDD